MTKELKPGEGDDEVGGAIFSQRALQEATGHRTELDVVGDEVVGALNKAGMQIVDPMGLLKGIQRVKNTPVADVVADCTAAMTRMDATFFQRHGIDLTNVEERLKRKYGEEMYERMAYSFKQLLMHVVYFVKINDQEQLPDTVSELKDILADDN